MHHPDPLEYVRDFDAVAAFLDPYVLLAEHDGQALPVLGTAAWVQADHPQKLGSVARYTLATLTELEPAVIAARLVAEIADGRREHRAAIREVGHNIHGGDRQAWRKLGNDHVPYVEIQRRRAVPGPLARDGGAA